MAKPEWGVKRVCQSCAAKFYDLNRSPITCPKCAASFDPEALLKSRRSRPPPAKPAKLEPAVSATADGATVEAGKPPEGDAKPDDDSGETASQSVDDSGETAGQSADDEDDASVLQDTSEVGDDDATKVVSTGDDD